MTMLFGEQPNEVYKDIKPLFFSLTVDLLL